MATEEVGVKLSVKGRREAAKALRDTADDIGKVDRKLDGIDGSSRKATRALDRAAQAGKRFGKGLAIGIGVGVAAVGAATFALARLARGWISSAAEQARLTRLTEAAITSTGAAAGVTAKQVEDLSNSISNATAVEDEVVQGAANLLLTFTKVRNEVGKGNDVFNQATQAAIDMSVALGTDANGAALQLGKALNDPIKGVTALSRAGVSFTQQQKDQIKTLVTSGRTLEAQKIILSEMSTQFGGAAAAAADPMERLRVIVGNVGQRIGFMLLPHVERFTNFLIRRGVPIVEGFLDEFDRGVGLGGRFRDTLDDLAAKGRKLWEEFRTGTGTGGDLRGALETAGAAAMILGAAAHDYVLPALKWLGEHPNVLKGVVAGMVALKVATMGAATAQLALNAAQMAGLGMGGDGKDKKPKGPKGKVPLLPAAGWAVPVAATVAGVSTDIANANDPRNRRREIPAGTGRPILNPKTGEITREAPRVVRDAPILPPALGGSNRSRSSVDGRDIHLYIDGREVLTTVEEKAFAREARR